MATVTGLDNRTASADVPDFVRPAASTLRTLRELDQLKIPLALFGDYPPARLEQIAHALWFSGKLAGGAEPLDALPATLNLPPSCIWLVTADRDEAVRAAGAGFTAVHLSPGAPQAIDAPDRRGIYVLDAIDDLLEAIRVPYTQSALHLRSVIGAVINAKAGAVPVL